MGRGRRSSRARTLQWMLAVVALTTAMVLASTAVATAAPASGDVEIKVLSNRADLVSDGDALVEIVRPAGTNPDSVRVELDGQDIVGDFALRPDGRFVGLVDGLDEGENHLTAAVHQKTARLTITDHPIGGPIFSGPHLRPWLCTTGANGLGAPVDAQCNAPTKVEFFYQPQGGGALQPYDPANPPGNVATTTTDEGETVPFIVRRERGTMDRGIYDVAVLFDPDEPWQPWEPQGGWNGKVVTDEFRLARRSWLAAQATELEGDRWICISNWCRFPSRTSTARRPSTPKRRASARTTTRGSATRGASPS